MGSDLSSSHISESTLRLDLHLRRVLMALYATAMLVGLLVANAWLVQLPDADQVALNWLVLAAGFLVVGMFLFPWHRFDRNMLLVPVLIGINLIALAVHFSGGWSSPLSVLYLFAIVFCAIYFASELAALCNGFVLLASVSPQLYTPDTTQLMEHLVINTPVYLALGFASWYVRRCILREYEINIQRVQEIEDRFRRGAFVDPLTNLSNRTHFEARLREESERAQRLDGDFVVVFLDLDDFKQINDVYGHRTGDEVLKLVAGVLQSNARQIDVVARYAGDEFIVLMPGTSLSGVRNFFERIRTDVGERSRFTLGFTLRLSAGAVNFRDAENLQSLLDATDYAMYVAKRRGKDRLFTVLSASSGEPGKETGLGG